jgi:two-component system, chemotaxis family, protein-glutamate methylesterase/glutaminase
MEAIAENDDTAKALAATNVIVVGASAGGVPALTQFVADLPAELDAAVFIVLHASAESPRLLADILARKSALPVRYAVDGDPIVGGEIRVAVPDFHLLLEPAFMRVVHGPKENLSRPSADPLFRSAAWSFGPAVIGIIMSGMLSDGTAGLWAIKSCSGTTIVQDPNDAIYPDMPRNAIQSVPIDHCVPSSGIGGLVARLVNERAHGELAWERDPGMRIETKFATMQTRAGDLSVMDRIGKLSALTCPACKGSLWEIDDAHVLRFRCHTGHAFSAEALDGAQRERIEDAVYTAIAALEEDVQFSGVLEKRFGDRDQTHLAAQYRMKAEKSRQSAEALRALLVRRQTAGEADAR